MTIFAVFRRLLWPGFGLREALDDCFNGQLGEANGRVASVDEGSGAPEAERWPRLPALKSRRFRNFLTGHGLSVIGGWMQQAALAWHVQLLNGEESAYWLGVTTAATALPVVFLAPLGGAAADRFAKRTVILMTQSTAMLAAFVFGMLIAFDWAPTPVVLVFAAINGMVLAFDVPARQAFLVEMVGRDDLMSAIALNSAVFNVGRMLGPMVFGWVVFLGLSACFFVNALSFAGLIAVVWRMTDLTDPGGAGKRDSFDWSGFRVVLDRPRVGGLIMVLAIVLLTGGTYVTLLPALASNDLGLGEEGYSLLLTINGLGSLLGSVTVAFLPSVKARRPTILLGIILLGAGLTGVAGFGGLWGAAASLFLAGSGFLLFLASTNSTVQLLAPDELRGRIMSLWVLTFGLCQPIGGYVAGSIAVEIGVPATLRYAGLASLLAVLLALAIFRLPESPEPIDNTRE